MRARHAVLGSFTLVLLAGASLVGAQACPSGAQAVQWPQANPVWKLCWTSPSASDGPDGSGLQLTRVSYKDRLVLWKLNMPVLNVLYDQPSGSCGPTYRDWLNELAAFEANNVVGPEHAEPTQPPVTVCNHPGHDSGNFAGVAIERLADRLVLTTQTRAGWYRYIQRIVFHADGSFEPLFGFTAVNHACTTRAHTHHGYWRFDFDIGGAANDVVEEFRFPLFPFPAAWAAQNTEAKRLRSPLLGRRWRVRDKAGNAAATIIPGAHDTVGGDAFGGSDAWILRYRSTEQDDGGATVGFDGDKQHIDALVNGEPVNGSDVVFWYRVTHRHHEGLDCHLVGPKVRLVNW